jgi:transcriptional regulator with XRE-family HTH domain
MNALSNVLQSSASSWAVLDVIAHEAGVGSRQASQALAGKPINAGAFLALCAVTGVDPVGGTSRPPQTLSPNVAWWLLSWALYTTRTLKKLDQRAAAKAIGISTASVCRAELGHPVSVEILLKVCAFIGVHPFGYMAPLVCPPEIVSRGTSTETHCSRSYIDSDTALAAPPLRLFELRRAAENEV